MDTIRVTIEIPAELTAALAGLLQVLKVSAVNINDSVVGGSSSEVSAPSLEEVVEYCETNNLITNAKRFYNFYSQRGWKDTKGKPVTNWQEKLIQWDDTDRKNSPTKLPRSPRPTYKDDTQRLVQKLGINQEEAE